jgi:hypothetical protein
MADCIKYLEISKKGAETSIELARKEGPGGTEIEELEEIETSHNRLGQIFPQYQEIMKKSLHEAADFLENMLEPHSWQSDVFTGNNVIMRRRWTFI